MPRVSLDWLDDLPNLGVPGVPGVPAQKTGTFPGTPQKSAGVPGVPAHLGNTSEHLVKSQGVPANALKEKEEHPEHLGTPDLWNDLAELPYPVGGWAAKLSLLPPEVAPSSISVDRWRELLSDADALLRQWGEQAIRLGWTEADLFSVPPGPERWGRGGLIMALSGRPVIAMTAEAATIPNGDGKPSRYYRREKVGAVMLWDRRAFDEQSETR